VNKSHRIFANELLRVGIEFVFFTCWYSYIQVNECFYQFIIEEREQIYLYIIIIIIILLIIKVIKAKF
jgi:hypothetical protein